MPLTEREELEMLELEELEALAESRVAPQLKVVTGEEQTVPPPPTSILEDVVSGVSNVGSEIAKSKADITGGIGGALTGARMGAPFGPVPATLGGIIGGIAGATMGKEIDQDVFKTRPQTTTLDNTVTSLFEEIGGRVFGRVLQPVFGYGKKLLGLSSNPKTIDDLFISEKKIDPTAAVDKTIGQAEKELFGESKTTVFEATGGRAGAELQVPLDREVLRAASKSSQESAFLKNRREMTETMVSALRGSPTEAAKIVDEGVKQSMQNAMKKFSNDIDSVRKELLPLRNKATVELPQINQAVESLRTRLFQELPESETRGLLKAFEKHLLEDGQFKKTVTLDDIQKTFLEIDGTIGKFKTGANVQTKMAGVYADTLKPLLKGYVEVAGEKATGQNKKIFELQSQFENLAAARGAITGSRIAKTLGLSESAQIGKGKASTKLENAIFESPQTWKEAQDIFDMVNPDLTRVMQDRFKNNLLKSIFDPKAAEIGSSKITSVLKKNGEDLINDVAGPEYLNALKNSRMVSLALETTKGVTKGKASVPEGTILGDIKRVLALPLAFRLGVFNIVTTGLKKGFGLDVVTDEHLFKISQGESGQRLIEDMINSPLADPRSYNTYIQFVRELGKLGLDVAAIPRSEYLDKAYGAISGINDAVEQQGIEQ